MQNILFVESQTRFEPINECMYCGVKEGDLLEISRSTGLVIEPTKLSDEHIIPFALGGTLLLPKSSCQKCASITAKFEQDVLRGHLYYPRIVGNFPTRRKKERPTKITFLCIGKDEKEFEKDFSVSDAISIILMPVFPPGGCLEGKNYSPNKIVVNKIDYKPLGNNAEDFIKRNRLLGFKIPVGINHRSFFRLLAKIAYAYYVAQNGLFPRSESPLLPIIFGENTHYSAQDFIGSSNLSDVEVKNQSLHLINDYYHQDEEGNIADSVVMQFFVSKYQKDCYAKYQAFVRIRPPKN